jgi:hypothetical protein
MGTAGKITYKNVAYTEAELQTHSDKDMVKKIIFAQLSSKENPLITKKYFSQHAEVALFRPRPQRNLVTTHSDRNNFRLE